MSCAVDFYGPVDVYARKEDGEFQAWADPFSVVGTGETLDAALSHLRENLERHLAYLSEEIRKHGEKVRVFTPLPEDLKKASRILTSGLHHARVPSGVGKSSHVFFHDPQ